MQSISIPTPIAGYWKHPAVIAVNNFKYKSLSDFSINTAVGCSHGCRFCYVPSTSANKQEGKLADLGVQNPDTQWGDYVFIRTWDEEEFLKSLQKADQIPADQLKADGNRAVMLCSTTDPYQVIKHTDPNTQRELNAAHREMVHRMLELIRDNSTLNVRILTRSGLAVSDFDLFKSFGPRLVFGMSVPTLNNTLARIYEPNAPSPSVRLKTLHKAKAAGLHVYATVAPTYPECDEHDLRATLVAIKELDPITIFHEPINIRAENVARIREYGESLGHTLNTEVFDSREAWEQYATGQLKLVERIAGELGIGDRLHSWPDKSFESKASMARFATVKGHADWLKKCWGRVSEWPGKDTAPLEKTAFSPAPTNEPSLSVRKPSEILAMDFSPDDTYLLNGVLTKGQPTTILGPGGVGKSRFVLQALAAIMTGRKFLEMEIRRRQIRCLILQAENSNRRWKTDIEKLHAWVGPEDWKVVEENLLIHTLEQDHDQFLSLNERAAQERIANLIRAAQADVVVFDPLFAFAAGNLNTDNAMIDTCKSLTDLARLGKRDCAIVVLHHTLTGKVGAKKAAGWDRASYGRGSKALQFWTRGQINIAPACANHNGNLVIACGKNSNGPEFEPFGIKLNPDTMIYEADPEFDLSVWSAELDGTVSSKQKPTPQAVADIVGALPLKRKPLAESIMETFGCEKSTAYTLIKNADGKTIHLNAKREFEKIAA